MVGETFSYLAHGIVVGAVDRRQFYKGVAYRQKGGLMWQKITIFGQCENTAYFDCSVVYENVDELQPKCPPSGGNRYLVINKADFTPH